MGITFYDGNKRFVFDFEHDVNTITDSSLSFFITIEPVFFSL